MKISYDYDLLLQELEDEIEDGCLNSNENINVLRNEQGYIIDWYYNDDVMKEVLEEANENENEKIEKGYYQDRPYLEIKKVSDVLEEMKRMNNIL